MARNLTSVYKSQELDGLTPYQRKTLVVFKVRFLMCNLKIYNTVYNHFITVSKTFHFY